MVKIGLIEDMSSIYADITGVGAVTKANMADPTFAGLLDVTKRKLAPFTGN